jgi:hypothetical protein
MSSGYIGKDLVHYGSGIVLDPDAAWARLDHSAKKNIRKAQQAGFVIERRTGTPEELGALRALWYFPDDPNFPRLLSSRDYLYLAFLDGRLAGGMILVPVGRHLFLNNLTADEHGKRHQLQGYLLWHAVNDLKDSGYSYIDIGVSYRVNLQRFFTKWSSFRYPVVFNPPAIGPQIRFHPFTGLPDVRGCSPDPARLRAMFGGRGFTLVPSMHEARQVARATVGHWVEDTSPHCTAPVQLVDLTELGPIQYGALVVGIELGPAALWDRFGCYDHFKSEYVLKCVQLPEWDVEGIAARRESNFRMYRDYFGREDVDIAAADGWIRAFVFSSPAAARLAERFAGFGVETRLDGDTLSLPCHQGLGEQDIEYVYAIYRGHLNLCSEWRATGVKGTIKLTGS